MTAPTNGQAQQAEQQPFMPDPHFAVEAQQEELTRLRGVESNLNDRLIYQRAVMLQIQAEAAHQNSLRLGEIEQLKAEMEQLRRQLFKATEKPAQDAAGDQIDEELADQIANGEQTGGEHTSVRIDEHELPTPDTAKFDHGDGSDHFPPPQAGIPVDQELAAEAERV
jgi:hypothetical protein